MRKPLSMNSEKGLKRIGKLTKPKVSISWSGGKDAALALYKILQSEQYHVVSLHTTFDHALKRVSMHGIPEALAIAQAEAIGLPLERIYIEADSTRQSYEDAMAAFCLEQKEKGIEAIVFGDILLEDLKVYREKKLGEVGLKAIFPLWGASTQRLAEQIIEEGFKTMICCLNDQQLASSLIGKTLDKSILQEIAYNADPCGEYGEYHTFVFDGPIFNNPVSFIKGKIVSKNYEFKTENEGVVTKNSSMFWFQEVLPTS